MKLLEFDYSKQDSFFLERKETMMRRFGIEEKYLSHVLAQSLKPKLDQATIHAAMAFQSVSKKEIRENFVLKTKYDKYKKARKRSQDIKKQNEFVKSAKEELKSGESQVKKIKTEREIWRKRKAFYTNYLKSQSWKDKRIEAIHHHGSMCQGCKCELPFNLIEVHHITYERLGNEKMSDLRIYCKSCHEEEHKRLRSKKRIQSQK
jgi:hypothetical protein